MNQRRAMLTYSHHPTPFPLLFILLFLSCIVSQNKLDCEILKFFSFNISPPSIPLNWSSVDCCLWEGISCNHHGRVIHLWLPFRGLRGGISPSLGNLTQLSRLNLSNNRLSGPLPDGLFSSLKDLKILDLSFNNLSGNLTSSLPSNSQPISFQKVDISSNQFSGTIQSSFFWQALNLISFNASKNSFTGPIPSSICINSSLIRYLDFSFNDFSGHIPHGFGGCSKLEVFRAGFNVLSGLLPYDIYTVSSLQEISLPVNLLSGPIGDGIVQLFNLTILELFGNQLTGWLPQDIGKLSNLEKLLLHVNNFNGSLPLSLMNCTNLITLNLRVNFLEGDISDLNFSKLQKLRVLDMGNNNFTGNLPASLYSCKSLTAIRLATNRLEGQIPPGMLALQSLSYLSLSNNSLTNISRAIDILMGCKNLRTVVLSKNFIDERMPDDDSITNLDGFQNIQVLGLGGCNLTGQVPTWIAKLRKLEVLDLSLNRITGSIPSWLGNLPKLFFIDLSRNLLSGGLPQALATLPTLTSEQVAAQIGNQSYLELPVFNQPNNASYQQYNRLSNLRPAIFLRNNSLSGNIPIEICQLQFLHVLDLSNNNFSGSIPDQISNLNNLEILDLSGNHLSGEIPASLGSLHFLSSFSVANNNLRGPIPSGTQLYTFPLDAYEGNPELCGFPLPRKCRSLTADNEHKDIQEEEGGGLKIPWFYVTVGFGYATGFLAVCCTLLFHTSFRHAYFQFLNDIKDKAYVITAVNMTRLQRRLWS